MEWIQIHVADVFEHSAADNELPHQFWPVQVRPTVKHLTCISAKRFSAL